MASKKKLRKKIRRLERKIDRLEEVLHNASPTVYVYPEGTSIENCGPKFATSLEDALEELIPGTAKGWTVKGNDPKHP